MSQPNDAQESPPPRCVVEQGGQIKTPKKRVTMIKHVVGKVRAAYTVLPEGDFVFGIASTPDEEGAGRVVSSWAQSEPSKPHESMRSFPATNREALRNGCLTARTQRTFAKNNPVMKPNPKSSMERQKSKQTQELNPTEDWAHRIFGKKSEDNDVPMTELLRCLDRGDYEETDYPDRSHRQVKGRLPPAKSTKSSRLLESHIEREFSDHEKAELFKMGKFRRVESKVKGMIQ